MADFDFRGSRRNPERGATAGVGIAECRLSRAIRWTGSDIGVRDGFAESIRDEDGQLVGSLQPEIDLAQLPLRERYSLKDCPGGLVAGFCSPAGGNHVVETEAAVVVGPAAAEEFLWAAPPGNSGELARGQSQPYLNIGGGRPIGFQNPAGQRCSFRQLDHERLAGRRSDRFDDRRDVAVGGRGDLGQCRQQSAQPKPSVLVGGRGSDLTGQVLCSLPGTDIGSLDGTTVRTDHDSFDFGPGVRVKTPRST